MSRVFKSMFTWGMVVAVVFSLSLIATDSAIAGRDASNDGPIIGPDPEVETPGDNDGLGGFKIRFHSDCHSAGDCEYPGCFGGAGASAAAPGGIKHHVVYAVVRFLWLWK